MKTICLAFFTLFLFTTASGQHASVDVSGTPEKIENTATTEDDLHERIAQRNALFKTQNEQAQRVLVQYLVGHTQYPESLRQTLPEGRVTIAVQLNKQGQIINYTIVESLDSAFDRELSRVMEEAPAVINPGQTYIGFKKIIIPIDFSVR